MSDTENATPPDEAERQVLPYEPRGAGPPAWVVPHTNPSHVAVAAVLTVLALIASVAGPIIIVTLSSDDDGGLAIPLMLLASVVTTLALLGVLAIVLDRSPSCRGMGRGIWIGIGVSVSLAVIRFAFPR